MNNVLFLQASVVMCQPDQTYFCINLTHYSPCVTLDTKKLSDLSSMDTKSYYCGDERCCQVGGESPCTYRCSLEVASFRRTRTSWSFPKLRKRKKNKGPLTSEEVSRQNKIVSLKTFIIREKDLETSEEEEEEKENVWTPSYRTFCPLQQWKNTTSQGTTAGTTTMESSTSFATTPITTTATPLTTITSTTMITKETTTSNPVESCNKEGQKIAHILNCTKYYTCMKKQEGFKLAIYRCRQKLAFSVEHQMCIEKQLVDGCRSNY